MKKIIIATAAGLLIIVASIFNFQANKIKDLEHQLTIKAEVEQQERAYSETKLATHSIKEVFNKECDFKILDGTASISHTYTLEEQAMLGIVKRETISGTATCYYQYSVPLDKAVVVHDKNKIIITLPKATLDQEATHRVANTFLLDEEKSSSSLFSNKYVAQKAMRYWEDTYDKRANENLLDLHTEAELQKTAKSQVQELISSLIGSDIKVEIN